MRTETPNFALENRNKTNQRHRDSAFNQNPKNYVRKDKNVHLSSAQSERP